MFLTPCTVIYPFKAVVNDTISWKKASTLVPLPEIDFQTNLTPVQLISVAEVEPR